MPLHDFSCPTCQRIEEHFHHADEAFTCSGCGGATQILPYGRASTQKSAVFPFTLTHLDGHGTPITIHDIGELRHAEQRYGVVFSAFSNNPSNPDAIPDPPRHRPGGRDYEPSS
jgi:ribosomal protein S27E